MSRKATKEDLLYYLVDAKVRVIALKGLWGTGKTHLWEEIKSQIPLINRNDHLYASCFGLESVEQIKFALFQNSLGKAEGPVTTAQKFSGFAIDAIEKVAGKLVPGAEGVATVVGSLGGIVQSVLIDKVLHSRLIILDDIERRGSSLQVNTLLGFIDLLKRNECKILLILNEEPLEGAHSSDWRTLKEKCLDRELMLLTSSAEAAGVGLSEEMPYRTVVIEALAQLNVTNIRVIQRIDRIVRAVFGDVVDLPDGMEKSMLPATVTLTALNFNAVPNGPDISSLMREWPAWCARSGYFGDERKGMSDVVAFGCNAKLTRDVEFLELLMQHVLTGHRMKNRFDALFQQRRKQEASNHAENEAIRYIEDTLLDPGMTNKEFVARATANRLAWAGLSADKASAIASDLEQRDAATLAHEIASEWSRCWSESPRLWNSHIHSLDSFHPVIKNAILEGNRHLSTSPPLIEVVVNGPSGGWTQGDIATINDATVSELVDTIYALNRANFGPFIYFFRREIKSPTQMAGGGLLFKAGTDKFLQAARQIEAENKSSRLKELLKMHLGEQEILLPDAVVDDSDADPAGT